MPLRGRPLVSYALAAFRTFPAVTEIILVAAAADMDAASRLLSDGPSHITEKVVRGGAERRDSVWQGLQEVTAGTDIVCIHDAARPFVSHREIAESIAAVRRYGAAVVARPVADTLKRAGAEGQVAATVDRRALWGAQTPQSFRTDLLRAAYARAIAEDWPVTDDAAVVERAGHRVQLVEGSAMNFKITQPEDLALAERLLDGGPRMGIGYDVHRLAPERPLVLGGVPVPHSHGLLGHSDADVLTHAIMDALLGAAALGDIGRHFPDTDAQYRGISSLALLARVGALVRDAGYRVSNIDAVVIAEAPRLAPYVPAMCAAVAETLGISAAQVSVKATTSEGLGFTGERAGMAAQATACLVGQAP